MLASYFASKHARECRRQIVGISAEARAYLLHYPWPGNVRELDHAIARAVAMGSTDVILPEDLPEAVLETDTPASFPAAKYHEVIKETKKQLILRAVDQAGGNYTEAAKLLGVHPNYLHRLIRNMNLKAALRGKD